MTKQYVKRFILFIDDETHQQLKVLAEKEKVSMAEVVRKLIGIAYKSGMEGN